MLGNSTSKSAKYVFVPTCRDGPRDQDRFGRVRSINVINSRFFLPMEQMNIKIPRRAGCCRGHYRCVLGNTFPNLKRRREWV